MRAKRLTSQPFADRPRRFSKKTTSSPRARAPDHVFDGHESSPVRLSLRRPIPDAVRDLRGREARWMAEEVGNSWRQAFGFGQKGKGKQSASDAELLVKPSPRALSRIRRPVDLRPRGCRRP